MMNNKLAKSIFLILVVVGIVSFTFQKQGDAPSWDLDKAHSSASFTTSHFFIPVDGTFDRFDGVLKFDPDNLEGSSANFTIEVASVNTKEAKRDEHLQSKDFFDAKTFPSITFKSTKISNVSDKEYSMEGDLTIRGKTKKVAIPFTLLNVMDHPMKKGSLIAGIKAKTLIKRSDFGIGTGDWATDKVIADETEVRIIMELSRKK